MLARSSIGAVLIAASACGAAAPSLPPDGFRSDLPVVVVESREVIANEPKRRARMRIQQNAEVAYDGLIGIELRGRSSQVFFPKRQFGLELLTEGGIQTERALLGMPAESDWVLYGPYSDKTMLRDALTFELSRRLGRYAPRSVFVELFLREGGVRPPSDEYLGLYLLMEKVSRGKERIDLPKSRRRPGEDSGFIVKLDWLDPKGGDIHFTTRAGQRVIVVYPGPRDVTEAQMAYLRGYFEDFEAMLDDESAPRPELVDLESFIDVMILNELAKNVDAYRSSVYLHKQPQGPLHLGPVWDFNQAYGNASYDDDACSTEGWRFEQTGAAPWFGRLYRDEEFAARFADRFRDLRRGPLSDEAMTVWIDGEAGRLETAVRRNFGRWPILGIVVLGNPGFPPDTYPGEVALLKQWLLARARWMDERLSQP
jgi:hypothetical protein